MDLSVLGSSVRKKRSALALGGLLALTAGAGSMQASSVLSTSASAANIAAIPVTIACNTQYGPNNGAAGATTPVTVTIHADPFPSTSGATIVVGFTPVAGLKITTTQSLTLSSTGTVANTTSNATGITFTISPLAGCAGTNSGASGAALLNTISVALTANGVSDNGLSVLDTVTGTTSALNVTPSVTVTCVYIAGTPAVYIPGAPQTVSVSSAANLGTPFTGVTGQGGATWLQLGPLAPSGTAGSTSSNFTVQASAGCGGITASTSVTLSLTNAPAIPKTFVVNITVQTARSPLTSNPNPFSWSYVKNSATPQTQTVLLTSSISSASTYYSMVNFPIWLTANYPSGLIPYPGGKSVIFSTTSAADSLAPGTYTATVFAQVSQQADYPITISLTVDNKAPTLSITSANPLAVPYTLGGSTPVSTITINSSDSPIPYTMSFGGVLAPMQSPSNEPLSGIAYSFGTNIGITYNPVLFETSAPGTVLSGTVTFTWGSSTPATVTVVTINLTVGSAAATLTSISPASLPTAAPNTAFYVSLTGSGFVGGADATLATRIGNVVGGTISPDTNFALTYVNPSNLTLKITVPALASGGGNGDSYLPFLVGGAGGTINLGIVNGLSATPTGTVTLSIGAGPIIYGAASSSSFTEVSGGALPSFAPYDMISIFGANFCASADTFPAVSPALAYTNGGCGSTTILPGKPDPVYNVFPFSLTPDQYILPAAPASTLWRFVTVNFYLPSAPTVAIPAPLLFATNGQINAIVPGGLTAGQTYNIVVSFGCGGCSPSTVAGSAPFPVSIVAYDPGVFTIGSDGQGPAAALNLSYALIDSANPAAMKHGVGNSDTIQLYVTGLGAPPSPTSSTCMTAAAYLTALDAVSASAPPATIDGAVLQSSIILQANSFAPCVETYLSSTLYGTAPVVTIGGVAVPAGAVTYAGFVDSAVAGLYQIDVQLPSTFTTSFPLQPNYIPGNTVASAVGEVTTLVSPMQLPVYVTIGGGSPVTSQAGVYINVAPRIGVAPLTNTCSSTTCVVGTSWPTGYGFTASLSPVSSPVYTYAVTSGVLPAGLSLGPTTGLITGIPSSDVSELITVTAYDNSPVPLSGSVTFTVPVSAGLYLTETANPTITYSTSALGVGPTIVPTDGLGPYTFSASGSFLTIPAGASTGQTGAISIPESTVAGTYNVTVTATDSTSGTPLTGSLTVPVTIALAMGAPTAVNNTGIITGGAPITTVQVTGYSGDGSELTCATNLTAVSCTVASGGLATVVASGSPLLVASASHPGVTITVTDPASPAANGFATGISAAFTIDAIN